MIVDLNAIHLLRRAVSLLEAQVAACAVARENALRRDSEARAGAGGAWGPPSPSGTNLARDVAEDTGTGIVIPDCDPLAQALESLRAELAQLEGAGDSAGATGGAGSGVPPLDDETLQKILGDYGLNPDELSADVRRDLQQALRDIDGACEPGGGTPSTSVQVDMAPDMDIEVVGETGGEDYTVRVVAHLDAATGKTWKSITYVGRDGQPVSGVNFDAATGDAGGSPHDMLDLHELSEAPPPDPVVGKPISGPERTEFGGLSEPRGHPSTTDSEGPAETPPPADEEPDGATPPSPSQDGPRSVPSSRREADADPNLLQDGRGTSASTSSTASPASSPPRSSDSGADSSPARTLWSSARASAQAALEKAVLGDFSDDTSWSGAVGQVAMGFVPGVGTLADVRDIAASAQRVLRGEEGAWVDLAVNSAGVVPGLDILKVLRKGRKGLGAANVTPGLGAMADEVGDAFKVGDTTGDAARGFPPGASSSSQPPRASSADARPSDVDSAAGGSASRADVNIDPAGASSGGPSERGSWAGKDAERIWANLTTSVRGDDVRPPPKFSTPTLDRRTGMPVTVSPDFMPSASVGPDGQFQYATRIEDAVLIADSKFKFDGDTIVIDNQIRGMLDLAREHKIPFVFLVKEGGVVSKGIMRYAEGVEWKVVPDVSGRIR